MDIESIYFVKQQKSDSEKTDVRGLTSNVSSHVFTANDVFVRSIIEYIIEMGEFRTPSIQMKFRKGHGFATDLKKWLKENDIIGEEKKDAKGYVSKIKIRDLKDG